MSANRKRALVGNADDPQQVANAIEIVRLTREQELAELDGLLRLPQFKRLVWRYLERAGVTRSTFTTDALLMAFNEGRRDMGNFILADVVEARPSAYVEMMQDASKRDRAP